MKTLTIRLASLSLLSLPLFACGSSDSSEATQSGSDYAEAIPDHQMLALSLEESQATSASAPGKAQQALVGEESKLHAHAKQVLTNLDELLDKTHAQIDSLIANAQEAAFTYEGQDCHKWEADAEQVHWRLVSCVKEPQSRRFSFALQGRILSATTDDAYKTIVAGTAIALPRVAGVRRGRGEIGYNFDNLASLQGGGVTGKLGIGFRAAGKARQLNIAIKDYLGEDDVVPGSAFYRYTQVKDKGGLFKMLMNADFLTRDSEGQLIEGTDGLAESSRATIAWRPGLGARAAAITCGGTLGEGQCIRMHQCWESGGIVSFEAYAATAQQMPSWGEAKCVKGAFDPEPSDQSDLQMPSLDDSETGAPVPDEPSSSDQE